MPAPILHLTMNRARTVQPSDNRDWEDPRIPLLRELADPIRLRVVDRLGHGGPATVSEMAGEVGLPLPQLSNHPRRLRAAEIVPVRREGRSAIYELTAPGLQALAPLLDRLAGRLSAPATRSEPDFARGRTCYDHLAGRLGVDIYAALLERDALRSLPDGTVELGPAAPEVLAGLGVHAAALGHERRRLAFECFDAREHAPHLAGEVGDALAAALAARGWTEPAGDRDVRVTAAGETALGDLSR